MMSTLSPQIFSDLPVPDVVSQCINRPCWLFILNVTSFHEDEMSNRLRVRSAGSAFFINYQRTKGRLQKLTRICSSFTFDTVYCFQYAVTICISYAFYICYTIQPSTRCPRERERGSKYARNCVHLSKIENSS